MWRLLSLLFAGWRGRLDRLRRFCGRRRLGRADVFAAFQAVAVVDFVGDVPGGGVDHDEFVEDVEVVADSDAENCTHVVDVKVEADPEGAWGCRLRILRCFRRRS